MFGSNFICDTTHFNANTNCRLGANVVGTDFHILPTRFDIKPITGFSLSSVTNNSQIAL